MIELTDGYVIHLIMVKVWNGFRVVRYFGVVLAAMVLFRVNSVGQPDPAPTAAPGIQDNSFLVEEAYNQNYGVVQHISSFARFWTSKDWAYTFTQEWPVPWDERQQFSYTLAGLHAGALADSGFGIGDVLLNYRYQLVGGGDTRVAFSPRVSLILASGDSSEDRGSGSIGAQVGLPLSVVLTKKIVSHWNAGATFLPQAKGTSGDRVPTAGYNLGQSFIWLTRPRFNVMMETAFFQSQTVLANNRTGWTSALYLSPGIRWSYNFKNGLQIVPGIAVPLGAGPSAGERGVFLYLSFEHPFRKLPPK